MHAVGPCLIVLGWKYVHNINLTDGIFVENKESAFEPNFTQNVSLYLKLLTFESAKQDFSHGPTAYISQQHY